MAQLGRTLLSGRALVLLALLAAGPPALARAAAGATAGSRVPRARVIRAQNLVFSPLHLVVRRGDRVSWLFLDAATDSPHTVTSVGRLRFRSTPRPMRSGSYTVQFTRAGVYHFMCVIHPASMSGGTVTVR